MQRNYTPKTLLALLAAVILALPFSALPTSAAPAPAHLDDEVTYRLATTLASELIPVIVEGADAAATNPGRAQQAEARVRNSGGHVVGSANLLGASVAELTPAQIRALAADPGISRIHIDADVRASMGTADTVPSSGTPIVFPQTVGAAQLWQVGDTGA